MSDCCLTPTQQFFSYIMASTSRAWYGSLWLIPGPIWKMSCNNLLNIKNNIMKSVIMKNWLYWTDYESLPIPLSIYQVWLYWRLVIMKWFQVDYTVYTINICFKTLYTWFLWTILTELIIIGWHIYCFILIWLNKRCMFCAVSFSNSILYYLKKKKK